jgi:hypothetical protein
MKWMHLLIWASILNGFAAHVDAGAPSLAVEMLSGDVASGTAGDYVTVAGQITNDGSEALSDHVLVVVGQGQ